MLGSTAKEQAFTEEDICHISVLPLELYFILFFYSTEMIQEPSSMCIPEFHYYCRFFII